MRVSKHWRNLHFWVNYPKSRFTGGCIAVFVRVFKLSHGNLNTSCFWMLLYIKTFCVWFNIAKHMGPMGFMNPRQDERDWSKIPPPPAAPSARPWAEMALICVVVKNEGWGREERENKLVIPAFPYYWCLGLALSDRQVAHYASGGEVPAGRAGRQKEKDWGRGREQEWGGGKTRAEKRMMECVWMVR